MSQLSISALTADVATNIYTNKQRLVKGNTVKQRMLNMIDSTLNKTDHANAANGYVAIASDGTVNMTVFAVASPANKFLRDDGTWQNMDMLPSQSGNNGKYLTTNGSAASWATLASSSLADFNTAVDARITNWVGAAPAALDTLDELAAALGDDANFAGTVTTALSSKAPLASPTFTGTPAGPTATAGTSTTQLATTAFVTTADNLKANIASPTFTGIPAAPTATAGTNTTQIATTAFVAASFAPLASPTFTGTPAAPTATAGTSTTQLATTAFVTTADNLKANIVSPTFTGTPAAPTASVGTNTTQIATTAFVAASFAPLASPTFTGTPAAPTATAGTNTTQLATTAFVTTADNLKANIASPTFTGTPAAPTAAGGTNTTQIATCAFVQNAMGSYAPISSPSFSGVVNIANGPGEYNLYVGSIGFGIDGVSTSLIRGLNPTAGFALYYEAGGSYPQLFTNTTAQFGTSTRAANTNAVVNIAASSTASASLNIKSGVAPTTPVSGDMWNESNKLMFYASAKEQIAFISSLSVYATTSSLSSYALLASPTFTGTPAAPTATAGTNTTQIATTAFVTTADNLKANIASPTFTGTPAAPTATAGTNTTQIATTAFVQTAISGIGSTSPAGADTQIQYNRGGAFTASASFIWDDSQSFFKVKGNSFFGDTSFNPTALVDIKGATTSKASLRIRSGSQPTSPNNGEIYFDGTDLFIFSSMGGGMWRQFQLMP